MMPKFIKDHWEQLFFGIVGLCFLAFSFLSLLKHDAATASATFAMAFFSFIYSNIARFKRFKGLGFEAELWEDKQKEAEQLIDRLKSVVKVYTREIVMQKVMQGRWDDGIWPETWDLYEELVDKHSELGQDIDFSDLKSQLDKVFLFDIAFALYKPICKVVSDERHKAQKMIDDEFGSTNSNPEAYKKRRSQLLEIPVELGGLLKRSKNGNVAQEILNWTTECKEKLADHFGLDVEFPSNSISELEKLSELCQAGPIVVTDKLMKLTELK